MAAFFDDDAPAAARRLRAAEALAAAAPEHTRPSVTFFGAIAALRSAPSGGHPSDVAPAVFADIEARRDNLERWGRAFPGAGGKAMLIGAELARLRGNDEAAARLYFDAASAAHASGQLMVQAIAWEFAATHRRSQRGADAARDYMSRARYCYGAWGAHAKVQRLTMHGGQMRRDDDEWAAGVLHRRHGMGIDLQAGMRAVQALSEEISLDKLVERVVETMLVQAGAQYGVLLLMKGGEPIVEAIGTVVLGKVLVEASRAAPTEARLPLDMLGKAIRGRRLVALADAAALVDPIVEDTRNRRGTRSAICVPLLRQGEIVGALYLENHLAAGAFTKDRAAFVEMLGQQAANSLAAARLYRELVDENERRAETEAALVKAREDLARTAHLTVMGGMAASIAHEINQPLAAIVNCSGAGRRWLAREHPDIPEAMAAFDQIANAAGRTAEIVHALRSLAKQAPASLAPLGINEVVVSVLELMRREIEERQVRLTLALSTSGKTVVGDGIQLQQVVLNLITNALEAMADTPLASRELTVSSGVEGGYVNVEVTDRGGGIDAATLGCMFDPFFTTKGTGMGMGLAICRSIMEAHGGTLDASSRIGHGSTLRFRVPMAARI
ncbi:ATP-binding protein [Cupriavidus plantarum]|uniref:ATP-binding protein n=1 Tax=Cupriavidus plantarum TaxID=942865 RepID=UPI001BAD70A1|nr:ATP-binding protein [Cupriavidus plantarum]